MSKIKINSDLLDLYVKKSDYTELESELQRLQAENFELKESLKVFQRPDITKILTLYKVGDIELLEQKCDKLQAENEELKTLKDMYFTYYKAKHDDIKGEFFAIKKENEHLKKCCTQAGEELEKHSFKWDGKEKNLVVQAMELNERFEKLEQENERLKEEKGGMQILIDNYIALTEKYHQTLQEIKKKCQITDVFDAKDIRDILDKINEVIGAE